MLLPLTCPPGTCPVRITPSPEPEPDRSLPVIRAFAILPPAPEASASRLVSATPARASADELNRLPVTLTPAVYDDAATPGTVGLDGDAAGPGEQVVLEGVPAGDVPRGASVAEVGDRDRAESRAREVLEVRVLDRGRAGLALEQDRVALHVGGREVVDRRRAAVLVQPERERAVVARAGERGVADRDVHTRARTARRAALDEDAVHEPVARVLARTDQRDILDGLARTGSREAEHRLRAVLRVLTVEECPRFAASTNRDALGDVDRLRNPERAGSERDLVAARRVRRGLAQGPARIRGRPAAGTVGAGRRHVHDGRAREGDGREERSGGDRRDPRGQPLPVRHRFALPARLL